MYTIMMIRLFFYSSRKNVCVSQRVNITVLTSSTYRNILLSFVSKMPIVYAVSQPIKCV